MAGAQRRDWDRGQRMSNGVFGLLCHVVMIWSCHIFSPTCYILLCVFFLPPTFYRSLLCFAVHCHIVMANRCQDYKFNLCYCVTCANLCQWGYHFVDFRIDFDNFCVYDTRAMFRCRGWLLWDEVLQRSGCQMFHVYVKACRRYQQIVFLCISKCFHIF